MNMHDANQSSGNGESGRQLPTELAAALRRMERPGVHVPPDVNERVRNRAREILEKRRSANLVPMPALDAGNSTMWWRWSVGVAAGFALLLAVSWFQFPAGPPAIAVEAPTIRDAFLLAQRIQAGGELDAAFDLNGDGAVTDADVEVLVERAVRIPPEGAL